MVVKVKVKVLEKSLILSKQWPPCIDVKGKGRGQVLDIALLHDEHMLRSALQSRKWQLIGMS